MQNKPNSLYIHIPFCAHICSYCDFTKLFYFQKYEEPYLKALFKELDSYSIDKVDTIYIGGGTPTSLSDEGFEKLLSKVAPYFGGKEFTVEANVENLTKEKLNIMKKYGVTRLSIGVESTSNKLLKEIGRHHSFEDAANAVKLAKNAGFNNINVDLIYGFEGETIEDLKNDVKNLLSLDVDHISTYSLIVEPGSIFFNKGKKEQNEEDSRKFYEYILSELRKNGYERYEVSNFARNKKYSLHNMTYWKNEEYYGCGLGASGYVNGIRYTNTKNLDDYITGKTVSEKEKVTKEMELEYFLLTNLRMEQGFFKKDFKDKFGIDFEAKFGEKIKQNKLEKLIEIGDIIHLTDDGILLMDFVILKLIN